MVNQSLQAPINPHFFQPLLPGFHSHLNIPVAFFLKHVKGLSERNKTAKLRSDASDITWLVKVDGLKFTYGWEDFALAHDLRIGDIVGFRHEGDMVFHVTPFGPNCCEIQYPSSRNMDDISNLDDQTNIASGNSSREKRVKKNRKRKVKSSSNHSRFVTKVSTWGLRNDRMNLPLGFTRSNGLHKMCGKKIVLLNEEGRSWKLSLKTDRRRMRAYASLGWTRFCAANGMSHGHYTFKLVQKSEPPVIRLCRAECRPKQRSESEFSSHHSSFEGSVIQTGLDKDQLYLPRSFVSSNGLDKGCSEVVLKNEQGRSWTLALKHFKSSNLTFLKQGWTSFCQANSIKAGDSFKFKLVGTGNKPVLSLCSVETNRDKTPSGCSRGSDYIKSLFSNPCTGDDSSKSKESEEEENIDEESISQKWLKVKKRKCWSRCRSSVENMHNDQTNIGNSSREKIVKKNPRKVESSSENSTFVANVSASSLANDRLYLPHSFARSNGLDKMSGEKIVLRNKEGRSWILNLIYDKSGMNTFARPGWRKFCVANRMSQGQQYTFKLVRKSGPPVMRLCLTKQRPKSESSSHHSYFEGSVSAPSLKSDKLYLRKTFVSLNGLDKGYREIVLKNAWGRTWNLVFKHYKRNFLTLLKQGWKNFCQENGLKAGDSFKFKLAGTREKPVLYLCPTESSRGKTPLECPEGSEDIKSLSQNSSSGDESSKSEESDEESIEDISQKRSKIKKRKYCSSRRASSSNSQNRFVILTVTPIAFRTYKLFLPRSFTQVNGITKATKITLLGKNGAKRVVDLFQGRSERMRFGKGWREYCQAQDVKINESFVMELIWGKEGSPVLKFCNKVNST